MNEWCFHGIALKTDIKKFIVNIPAIVLANETSYLATNSALWVHVEWCPEPGRIRLLCNDNEDDESFWAYFSEFVDVEQPPLTVPNTTNSRENCCSTCHAFPVCLYYRSKFMWSTRLIRISHMINTTDTDFSCDGHDWYGKISCVLPPTHSPYLYYRAKFNIW